MANHNGNWQSYTQEFIDNIEIRKTERNSFRKCREEINSTPETARLHKSLAKKRVDTAIALKKTNGNLTENEKEIRRLLFETHLTRSSSEMSQQWTNTYFIGNWLKQAANMFKLFTSYRCGYNISCPASADTGGIITIYNPEIQTQSGIWLYTKTMEE